MKTRRTPRWTTANETRFNTLAMQEAANFPRALTTKQRNELTRLDRIRSARYWASMEPSTRRRLRRQKKWSKALQGKWLEALAGLKTRRLKTKA